MLQPNSLKALLDTKALLEYTIQTRIEKLRLLLLFFYCQKPKVKVMPNGPMAFGRRAY